MRFPHSIFHGFNPFTFVFFLAALPPHFTTWDFVHCLLPKLIQHSLRKINWKYSTYLKLFEEDFGEGFPEVWRAENGLDDHHSSVSRIDQKMPAAKWSWLHWLFPQVIHNMSAQDAAWTCHDSKCYMNQQTHWCHGSEVQLGTANYSQQICGKYIPSSPEVQHVNKLLQDCVKFLCVDVILHYFDGLQRGVESKSHLQHSFVLALSQFSLKARPCLHWPAEDLVAQSRWGWWTWGLSPQQIHIWKRAE